MPHCKLPGVMSNDVKMTLREGVCCMDAVPREAKASSGQHSQSDQLYKPKLSEASSVALRNSEADRLTNDRETRGTEQPQSPTAPHNHKTNLIR